MSSEMDNLRESATEMIYLVPDREEGQLGYVWCDDPAPGLDMDPSEAVEYVRKDVHDAALEREQDKAKYAHRLRLDYQALCEKLEASEKREAELAAHVERFNKAVEPFIGDNLAGCGPLVQELVFCRWRSPATSLANLKAEWDQDELQPIWETLIKVADMLGIDPEKARRGEGKPSETYAAHLTRRDLIKQAEVLDLAESAMANIRDAATLRLNAEHLRQLAQEATQ